MGTVQIFQTVPDIVCTVPRQKTHYIITASHMAEKELNEKELADQIRQQIPRQKVLLKLDPRSSSNSGTAPTPLQTPATSGAGGEFSFTAKMNQESKTGMK